MDFKQSVLDHNSRCCAWSHFSAQFQVQEPQHAQGTLRKWHWVNKLFLASPRVEAELSQGAQRAQGQAGLGRAQRDLCNVPWTVQMETDLKTLDLLQTDLCVRQQCHKAEITEPPQNPVLVSLEGGISARAPSTTVRIYF